MATRFHSNASMWDDKVLSDQFSRLSGLRVVLVSTDVPCKKSDLSAAEKLRFLELKNPTRKISWLKGRNALKVLLTQLGEDPDTSHLQFPNRKYSLTHSGEYAIGVASQEPVAGIGIDFQTGKYPRIETTRHFLIPEEIRYVESLKEEDQKKELLRLWTIKEAVFKANPQNVNTWYTDYAVENPGLISGLAIALSSQQKFRYASIEIELGYISLAVKPQGETHG